MFMERNKKPRVIVLGIDGACWSLVKPWLANGELPNLSALMDVSAWGPLTSQFPPVTSPNWRCYATGRNPAKLGVFWWEVVDRTNRKIHLSNASDFHTQPYWQDIASEGRSTAVINFPTGYPLKAISNGMFSAGGPGAPDHGFTVPGDWETALKANYQYQVHPTGVLSSADQLKAQREELLAMLESRFQAGYEQIAQQVDFVHITLFYINVIQHFCYQDEPTLDAWKLIDRHLGTLRSMADEGGYHLMLMSDHGCGPVDTVFYINTWLEQEGFLVLKKAGAGKALGRLGINRQRMADLARRAGVTELLRKVIPVKLTEALPSERGTFDKEAKGSRIDWDTSKVVASGQGPIYILRAPDDPEYETIRRALAYRLSKLRNPVSGLPVAAQIHKREDIYNGPFLGVAPDLVFEQGVGIHTSGGVGHQSSFSPPDKWAADNLLHGLFLMYGPSFEPNPNVADTRIIDLAPTVLHLMGLPIQEDVDGCVLHGLFRVDSDPSNRQPIFRKADAISDDDLSMNDQDALAERLTDLGYLG